MTEWLEGVISDLGYLGVVLLMILENVFPPIPSEVVLPFAGLVTAQGDLDLIGVIVAATLGTVLGALPLYYLGAWVGQARLERFARRHGAWFTLSRDDVVRARDWFDRHGGKAVLICRFIPGLRSIISIPAGVVRMNLPRFLLLTTLGSLAWCAALASLGRWLGNRYRDIATYLDPVLYVLIAGGVVWYVVRIVRQRGRRKQARSSD